MIVSATRVSRQGLEAARVPANVTVITSEDLARTGAATIAAALGQVEGFTVMDQQGLGIGADTTVNLRGLVNSARTGALVLVDGVRQNRITGDDIHWQSLPISQIERIEVLRGGSGTIYGEGALAGVINILTKHEAQRPLETEHGVEFGSFGWQRYTTNVRGRSGPARYGVNYSRRLLEGYRESSQSRNTTLRTFAGVEPMAGLSATVNVMHSEDVTGFPGLLTLAQTERRRIGTNAFHGYNTNEIDQVSLDVSGGPWAGVSSDLTLYWRRWTQYSEDSSSYNFFTVTPSHGLHWRGSYALGEEALQSLLVGGIELANDKATTGDPGFGADSESNKASYGLYVEETLTLWDRASCVGGLRFDKARFQESLSFPTFDGTLRFEGWSPKLGLTVNLLPEALDVFASYARPYKSPNVDDFSSRLGSSFAGNADLQPQQADSYEVGARFTAPWGRANATAFYSRLKDEILFNGLVTPFGTNQNFDTRRFGTEWSLHVQPPESRVRGSLAYTFLDAEFSKGGFSGRTIPGVPEHLLNTSVGVSPAKGLWVDLAWLLVQDFYRINDFNNQLGGADNYGVVNVLARYEIPRLRPEAYWPDVSVYFRIENLTSEEYSAYQASTGTAIGSGESPALPIGFYGGIDVRF
jgi:outer membrane receptor protein involved in Fe transport